MQNSPKRVKGFKGVVVDLIKTYPGRTDEEYARMALAKGLCGSASKDPVFSLRTTLKKEYREGRMPEIRAVKVSGKPHYFPANYSQGGQSAVPRVDSAITLMLAPEVTEIVDVLVDVGKFSSRPDAVNWLLSQGIRAKVVELAQAKNTLQQIKQLKQSLSI